MAARRAAAPPWRSPPSRSPPKQPAAKHAAPPVEPSVSRVRLRSLLYTPGDRPDRYQKALREAAADIVVADLEDAVAPAGKAAARADVRRSLDEVPVAKPLRGVRINAWPGRTADDDLAAVLGGRPDVIVVPKCEDPEALEALDEALAASEEKAGIEPGSTRLIPILETAAGVLAARAIAAATSRTLAVCFGAEDLAADAGMRRSATNVEVATARQLVVLGAAAAGVAAIDMITADVKDLDRCLREAAEARAWGFAGKMVIHPNQARAVHEAFAPTPQELEWARRVADAADKAGAASGGVLVVDGRMVDVPVIRQARRILADAE